MRRPGTLTDQDRREWISFAQRVRPLAGRAPVVAPKEEQQALARPPARPMATPKARPASPPIVTGAAPPGLDKASWRRFAAGNMTPERTLDLHGKTVHAAHLALVRFLHAACGDKLRCVEIITGRGGAEGVGAIRRELPLWLNLPALRPLVLAAAHPHKHNDGATRVLLRRSREPRAG